MSEREQADLVVVGAGTIGGWASWFAARDGVDRVVVLERRVAGQGASGRAAGIVRAQGGTPTTVALGRWSIDFYRRQAAELGTDSGFRELGYLILAVTDEDERSGRERVAMQQAEGLAVRWLSAAEAPATSVTLSPDGHRGGSYLATDGHIDPPPAADDEELRSDTSTAGR
ncbi:MAG: FAD-binding oxidoreductase [Chloroflexi bacterium]|nr:FAD-binding oxidoreductase [Chloroflexota bacterium]